MSWIWLILLLLLSIVFTTTTFILNFVHSKQIELDELNTLFQCENCGKFYRKYQEELQLKIDPNYKHLTCPSCYGPSSLYTGIEYKWIENNPLAPKLTNRDAKKIKKVIRKVEKLQYEDQSIEKFLYYYRLIPEKRDGKKNPD